MSEESITLDEDAYELLEAQREDDGSISEVIRRLLGPGPPEGEDVESAGSAEPLEDVGERSGDEDVEM